LIISWVGRDGRDPAGETVGKAVGQMGANVIKVERAANLGEHAHQLIDTNQEAAV
jgi:phosphoribosylformylglycinamidine (FGAM) synthase PurS component